jgi:hypothetical protein
MAARGDVILQENKTPSAMSSTMAQLAQEAAAAVKEKKAVPTPLKTTAKEASSSATTALGSTADSLKGNLLSPASIPLPATPALASRSPPPSSPKNVLSPTSSKHSIPASPKFIPEKSEPPQMTHRGSSLSLASDDEIRKIESDEMIPEDSEGEEEAEKSEASKPESKKVLGEPKDKKAEKALALEEVEEDAEDEEDIDKVLFGDADEEEEEVVPEPVASTSKETESAKSAVTQKPTATKSETEELTDKVSKVKIQDQAPAVGKHATDSVED